MTELNQELHDALEREAAIRAILRVISRSRTDYGPVFDAILDNAIGLCDAPFAMLLLCRTEAPLGAGGVGERGYLECVATRGTRSEWIDEFTRNPQPLDRSQKTIAVRSVLDRVNIHCEDLADDQLYRDRHPQRVQAVEIEGIRTALAVPIAKDDESVGTIVLYRREVRPFNDKQIDLVSTFAEQAVIAIENVRLFQELEARTREVSVQAEELARWNQELETRVSTQVDELDRLGRLRRFLSPQVADAVVSSGEDELLGSHRALIAVLYCDLRGFTAFCESAEPEEAIEVLQTYHAAMGMLIHEHGARLTTEQATAFLCYSTIHYPVMTLLETRFRLRCRCATAWPSLAEDGAGWGTDSVSALGCHWATPPSAWWGSRDVTTTPLTVAP